MQRVLSDRLAVFFTAVASLAVLWFGSGLAQQLAVADGQRGLALAGTLGAQQPADYLQVLSHTVAPLLAPAGMIVEHVNYEFGTLPSRFKMA